MPGLALSHDRWRSGVIVVRPPPIYLDRRRAPSELPLYLTPAPELYWAFDGDLGALTYHLDRLVDHGLRCIREKRRGRPFLGAKAVRRIHPWSEPRTRRETRGRPIRTFKAGARDILGLEVSAAKETTQFRHAHRAAHLARRYGDVEHHFPFGTYAARVYHGAPIEPEPPADAVVARPGRTLEEVKEDLAERRRTVDRDERRAACRSLVEEVKAAFDDEPGTLVENDDLPLGPAPGSPGAGEQEGESPEDVEFRHLCDRRPPRPNAARIVTLRDERRGRARRGDPRGASDPPG